jgi:hypothetical protein
MHGDAMPAENGDQGAAQFGIVVIGEVIDKVNDGALL